MKYLKVFTDFAQSMEALGDAERGRLFTAMLEYAESGKLPDLRGNERFLWGTAKAQIDRAQERYDKDVANGKKGGRPKNPNKPIETQANPAEPNETQANPNKPIETREEEDKDKEEEEEDLTYTAAAAGAGAMTPEELEDARMENELIRVAKDCGLPTGIEQMRLANQLWDDYSYDWLIDAIRRCARRSVQSWGYVHGILQDWRRKGYRDSADAEFDALCCPPGKVV